MHRSTHSNHATVLHIPKRKLGHVIDNLEAALEIRSKLLTEKERARANDELRICREILHEHHQIGDLMAAVAKNFKPLYSQASEALTRIHEIARVGTLASCLSSLETVQAFFDLGLCDEKGVLDTNLIIGRGHIAPAFYACRYIRSGVPFLFLLAVHQSVPAVINEDWGFANTMRHSLGEAIGFAVGRSLSQKMAHPVYCFVGDGELNEGVSYEGIRLAYEYDVKNLIVIIDENGRGIDPLPSPLNIKFLESYFDQVNIIDGHDQKLISETIESAKQSGARVAIVCKTNKGKHSYKPAGASSKASTCGQIANLIQHYQKQYNCHTLTADLAARFGLKSDDHFYNTGLAEASLLTIASGMPKDHLKFVLTDDKYYLNSIDVMHSALLASRNIHIIASRKNKVWGGPTYLPSVLTAIGSNKVYELTDINDLNYFIDCNIHHGENGIYLFYDQSADNIHQITEGYTKASEDAYIKVNKSSQTLLISSESTAYEVSHFAKERQCTHIRFLSTRPDLSGLLAHEIKSYQNVIVVEHNNGLCGLAEYIESKLLIRVQRIHDVDYEWPTLDTFQTTSLVNELNNCFDNNNRDIKTYDFIRK